MTPTKDQIVARASAELFAKPLLTNIHRAVVAEAIVATALEPEWTWCSGDYASCDFKRSDGARLEVKQSASLQSWNAATLKASQCSFDIAERSGEWEDGVRWVARRGRNADVFLFCHHPIVSPEADHRDAAQWRFFPVPEKLLPKTKRIALSAVEKFSSGVEYWQLARAVAQAAT